MPSLSSLSHILAQILKRGPGGGWVGAGEGLHGSLDGDDFMLNWDVVGALEAGGLDEH